jgi:hypothetical protein
MNPSSKWEFLEFLHKYGPLKYSELCQEFGKATSRILIGLQKAKLVQKIKITYSPSILSGVILKKIILDPHDKCNAKTIIELTENAYEYLKKCNVDSFLKTPGALRAKKLFLKRNWKPELESK